MIDWFSLAFDAVWLLGLSVILAALSLASYRAASDRREMPRRRHTLRRRLSGPGFRLALLTGLALVFLGALLSSTGAWHRITAGVGLALCVAGLAWAFRSGCTKCRD
ncbi:MAG TPA: hypothetical protein VMX14_04165 [Anaerolineae bacterium]|nr:hypothetical protein [Anaerolineae bacterium]